MYRNAYRICVDRIRAIPFPAMGSAFLVGLLLGWLIIGWWLWPVDWTDADPWDLRVAHQERYVVLVAGDYTQSRNADQARQALAGWDDQALADLLATMQNQTSSLETRRQLAELGSVLALPKSEPLALTEPGAFPSLPSLRSRLVTVCGTAVAVVAAAVLIIFAASARPWESIAKRVQEVQPATAVEEPELTSNHFLSIYSQDQDDYADYFPIKAPNGRFLGECGLKSIGRLSGRGTPQRVSTLEMVLLDSLDHCTETRILMSRYGYEDGTLRRELTTHGELILAEPGAQILVETKNLQMLATITDLEYADQEPAQGVFQRMVVDLEVKIMQLPAEATAEVESSTG